MNKVYAVGQINQYIKNLLAQETILHSVSVKGEVSNVKYHSSGHIYFTMKDNTGTLSCVMFASARSGLKFTMREGMGIIATGRIEVYMRDGKYQLYAEKIVQDGAGDLYARYLELKDKLEEMGMFDQSYKKDIPYYSRTIGIVTAATGAAVQDIIQIAHRRNPYVQLILCPAQVQGDGAAQSIVDGIEALDRYGVDVIIVGRGGGSIEDLWAFNEEIVARAIFACNTPIVSAVGHETDFTIADFVADKRASTPSAAAELTVVPYADLEKRMQDLAVSLFDRVDHNIRMEKNRLHQTVTRLQALSPGARIREKKMHYVNLLDQLQQVMQGNLMQNKHRLQMRITELEALSPLTRLQGGYVHATAKGKPLTKVSQVSAGDEIRLRLADGTVQTRVENTEKEKIAKIR
ncbi:MAG: exodeoxyribonuclease VII large subunit [Lachnospiraceae bacterium]|nr:exodeoxyribonuclease VII large subunit [Lachnospiraceae bacterium]